MTAAAPPWWAGAVVMSAAGTAAPPWSSLLRKQAGGWCERPRVMHSLHSAQLMHDFTVPALWAAVRLTPGSTASLELSGAAPGTYTVYCTLHSDTAVEDPEAAGMAALLVVR